MTCRPVPACPELAAAAATREGSRAADWGSASGSTRPPAASEQVHPVPAADAALRSRSAVPARPRAAEARRAARFRRDRHDLLRAVQPGGASSSTSTTWDGAHHGCASTTRVTSRYPSATTVMGSRLPSPRQRHCQHSNGPNAAPVRLRGPGRLSVSEVVCTDARSPVDARRPEGRAPDPACGGLPGAGVSRSWFYKWRGGTVGPRAQRRRRLAAKVARLFRLHGGRYGSLRITAGRSRGIV